jgi:hypothetical protein
VAKVSEKLAMTLEKLLKALKELGSAVKAAKNLEGAKNALSALKNVKTAAQEVREFEQGGDGLGKLAKDAWKDKSLAGVGDGLKDFAVRKGVGYVDGKVTGLAHEAFNEALGRDPDTEMPSGDLSGKGLAKEAGGAAWEAAKAGLTSETNKSAVEAELTHDLGLSHDPEPYRVDRSKIEQAFG